MTAKANTLSETELRETMGTGEMSEHGRISFIVNRDGIDAARTWAKQTVRVYRRAVLDKGNINRKPHFATLPEYRPKFIRSYCEIKAWLRNQQ